MRPPDSQLLFDLPSGRATYLSRTGTVYPAQDTGYRAPCPNHGRVAIENKFPMSPGDRRLSSGRMPAFYHSSCVGNVEAQDERNKLDSLRIIYINRRDFRKVRAIDRLLNEPWPECRLINLEEY